MNLEKMAENMYLAYGKSSGGLNFRGEPMPEYKDLPEQIRLNWVASAEAALLEVKQQAFGNVKYLDFVEIQEECREVRNCHYNIADCISQKLLTPEHAELAINERRNRGGERFYEIIISKTYTPKYGSEVMQVCHEGVMGINTPTPATSN